MTEDKKDFTFDSIDLLSFVNSKTKILTIVTVVAFLVSSIVSFFIKDRYESSVILFPASSSSISQSLLTDNNNKKEILKFGDKEEVDQLLQVLYSDQIRNRIIDKFDLLNHYNISHDSKYKRTKLKKEFDKNIMFSRTEYMSVRIDVLDVNPQKAADIANDIADLVDSVMTRIQKERSLKALAIVEHEFLSQKEKMKKFEDSLSVIRKKGIMNYESQAEVYNDAYATAISEGRIKGAEMLQGKLDTLALYGGAYVSLRDLMVYETEKLSILEAKFIEAKVDAEQDLPHRFVVSRAEKAEKATYPMRWLIVLVSTISAFILALLLLIITDSIKKKN
ncbi:MAG: hypothetical protein A2046_03480 [Bacteroidetes bacterium GWA2_30_7]|nr:MAG: hypothetical protein A2046_03480 [Bacteroidetes bacterium GWA2_30_7]